MRFLIITTIPARQALLGVVPEKHVIEETEADSLKAVKESVHIPVGGECRIVDKENVTTLKLRMVNEVVES